MMKAKRILHLNIDGRVCLYFHLNIVSLSTDTYAAMSGLNAIENFMIVEERKRQSILGEIVPIFSIFGLLLLIISTVSSSMCLPFSKYMLIDCSSIKMVWKSIWYLLLMQPTFIWELYKN